MCGIVGFTGENQNFLLSKMASKISHRGPDGYTEYKSSKINIGFHRLSINDLNYGNQPFIDQKTGVLIFCNGEIYNFIELKNQLREEGYCFNSNSDCEVILFLYLKHNLNFLSKINGMFFISIWDPRTDQIFLIRDRIGIKPGYYTELNNKFYFSSEIKPLLEVPYFKRELNLSALDEYFSYRYVNSRNPLIKSIKTIFPGEIITYKNNILNKRTYWKYNFNKNFDSNFNNTFKKKFTKSNHLRLLSDTKVGIFLSGGLDSSLITSISSNYNKNLEVFSHGFDENKDELHFAEKVIKFLNIKNFHKILIQKKDIYNLERIILSLESPIANSDIIGLDLLCSNAKKNNTKVILSGEGSDELFGSYIHRQFLQKTQNLKKITNLLNLNYPISKIIQFIPNKFYNKFFNYGSYKFNKNLKKNLSNFFLEKNFFNSYKNLISLFNENDKKLLFEKQYFQNFSKKDSLKEFLDNNNEEDLNKITLLELSIWLESYHLMKEDRISMAHSVEMRFPFLDHELVELVLKNRSNIEELQNKKFLKNLFKNQIPNEIIKRKKGPILVPLIECFGKEFINLSKETLKKNKINNYGILKYDYIEKLIKKVETKPNFTESNRLFAILSMQIWLDNYLK